MDASKYDINEIIDSMPDRFTSHKFIQVFTQAHQHDYIEALCRHIDSDKPFQSVHAQIAKSLHKIEMIRHVKEEACDADIFGRETKNAIWEKIAQSN